MPNLTETATRDWQRAGHGEIVCHCEMVTRREIEAAFGRWDMRYLLLGDDDIGRGSGPLEAEESGHSVVNTGRRGWRRSAP